MFGESYNFVSFDPRGVGISGPSLDCFRNNTKARTAFNRAHYTGATNVSSTSFEEQYYSAAIYGEWCNKAVKMDSPHGYYVTTPAVARDLLAFIEAEAKLAGRSPSKARLWGFGNSCGTVIGTTFASIFPYRVGRLVLESVMDVDQYYSNDWRSNFVDSDKVLGQLPVLCHAAGPDLCAFWGATPDNITARMDTIIQNIQSHPIPVSGIDGQTLPGLATYSDLKSFLVTGIYEPLAYFPIMADVFLQLERGNASAIMGMSEALDFDSDGSVIIRCVDSYRDNKLITIEDWKEYIKDTVSSSKYIGDIFPIWARTILCRSLQLQLPDSMMIQGRLPVIFLFQIGFILLWTTSFPTEAKSNPLNTGPVTGVDKPLYFPILFTSNTLDPVAPAAKYILQ
jgi:pimeloyl-ACP methyl ester carboxylesterase